MEFTKGEWKSRHPVNNDYTVYTGEYGAGIVQVAMLFESSPNAEVNANLIVGAVNACIKLNPENPLAVAQSIGDMYEALKAILPSFDSIVRAEECDHSVGICWCADRNAIFEAKQVLAKAEGR